MLHHRPSIIIMSLAQRSAGFPWSLLTWVRFRDWGFKVNNKIKIDKVLCHSMNPEGRANMVAMLWGNGYNALNMPWAWEYKVENVLQQF
jgi:hypothetical protein